MKHAIKPNAIPKKICLETTEVNWILSFAKIPMDAETKITKPIIKRATTIPRKTLSIPLLFDDIYPRKFLPIKITVSAKQQYTLFFLINFVIIAGCK